MLQSYDERTVSTTQWFELPDPAECVMMETLIRDPGGIQVERVLTWSWRGMRFVAAAPSAAAGHVAYKLRKKDAKKKWNILWGRFATGQREHHFFQQYHSILYLI